MRIAKLLVLSALCLFGNKAFAVDENVWEAPVLPTPPEVTEFVDFQTDTELYLYNVGAKLFFAQGNSWGTQVSVGATGLVSTFLQAEGLEGVYLWSNQCSKGTCYVFTESGTSGFVDLGTQTYVNPGYEIVKVGDAWRISASATAPEKIPNKDQTFSSTLLKQEGKWYGLDVTSNASNTAVSTFLGEGDGKYVDWQFVSPEVYEEWSYSDELIAYNEAMNEYNEAMKPYTQAMALLKALQAAEELGINASSFEAIYNDTSNDEETLKKAVTDLQAIVDAKNALKKLLEEAAEVGAPAAAAQAVYDNADATAAELKKATDALTPMVEARAALKKALDDATESGFDAAEYKAVFDNAESTVDQIKKATTDLTAALVEWGKTHATVDKPADMTSFIKNPNFDNASSTGWSGTAPNMTGDGNHGKANVAEKWNDTFDTYQDIEGLPAGIYVLNAKTSWRGSWKDMEDGVGPAAKLYAVAGDVEQSTPFNYIWGCKNTEKLGGATYFGTNAGENTETHDGVSYYSPNDPSAFRLYAEKGFYDTEVMFSVFDGKARIGVKNPNKLGDADNWSCFDTFVLTYYGGAADACQLYLPEALKNYSAIEIEEGTVYTEAYLTAYNEALAGEHKADNIEELQAVITGLDGGKKNLEKNIELWKTYKKKAEESFAKYCTSGEYDFCISTQDLSDYVDSDIKYVDDEEFPGYETNIDEHALTNEELQAEIDYIDNLCEKIDKEAKEGLKEGDDVTRFLKNADFEMCDVKTQTGEAPYWTVKKDVGNVTAGPLGQGNYDLMVGALGKMNYCFESWHSHDFDVYQEVSNVPEGVYVIEAQGYVRCENKGYTAPNEVEEASIPIHLYLNNATDVFPNVYSELAADEGHEFTKVEDWTTQDINGNLYPNSMGAAAQCFEWGMYKMQTYGLVKEGETMRIGVKGKMKTDDTENWWCIWDNFKLTYQGYNVNYVQPALDKAMANIDVTKPMGKNVYATAKSLADKADEAKKTGDGKTMFQMLADVYDASAAIISSVQLFATLTDAIENEETGLNSAIFTSSNVEAKAEAQTLVGTITSGIQDYDINDDEVAGLLEQIEKMKTKLRLPGGLDTASDSNPIDVTSVIMSADFGDEIGDNTIAGWTTSGGKFGENDYLWVLAYESWQSKFSINQDFIGLPAGTYEVTVSGFCRNGDNQQDYDSYQENPAFSLAYVYAINGDSAVNTVPMAAMASYGLTDESIDGVTEFIPTGSETTYYIPGNLAAAKDMMTADVAKKWVNTVVVKVLEDGKLSIGIKKDSDLTNSWVVIDDWKLTYFGANSSKEASGDAATAISIVENEPVNVEFFTLDGRKATRAQKGVIIQKTTLGNGATIIKKIMK